MKNIWCCLFILIMLVACSPAAAPTLAVTAHVPTPTGASTTNPPAGSESPPSPVIATAESSKTMIPTWTATDTKTPSATPSPTPTATPTATATTTAAVTDTPSATETPAPTDTPTLPPPTATPDVVFYPPGGRSYASLEALWNGQAEWVLEEYNTGLPGGESDTVWRGGNEFWSYLHASYQSAGVVDQCGDPVPFPGCTTLWKSHDGGLHFTLEEPVCLFACESCPCSNSRDHIAQQQYPRVAFAADQAYLVYEFGAFTYLRTSSDGIHWSAPAHVPGTGVWYFNNASCSEAESIGDHPNIYRELEYDCLIGAPPGIFVEGDLLAVFVGLGKAPGHMGCYTGNRYYGASGLSKCAANPLFGADLGYGPVEALGADANPYFDFRTVSSADVVREGNHYYMVYEGDRGPSNPTVVDDQFGLGLARSAALQIDGPWEKWPSNPMIMNLPGNVGVGHADLLQVGGGIYLYTSTADFTRGRYVLVYK